MNSLEGGSVIEKHDFGAIILHALHGKHDNRLAIHVHRSGAFLPWAIGFIDETVQVDVLHRLKISWRGGFRFGWGIPPGQTHPTVFVVGHNTWQIGQIANLHAFRRSTQFVCITVEESPTPVATAVTWLWCGVVANQTKHTECAIGIVIECADKINEDSSCIFIWPCVHCIAYGNYLRQIHSSVITQALNSPTGGS